MFTFSPYEFKPNKLIDKMLPAVQVDTSTNTIKCKESDTEVAIVRAQTPLQTNGIITFFQAEILKCSSGRVNDCAINIGLVTKDGNPRAYTGKYMNSVGYFNGEIYLNKKKVCTVPHFSKKDRVGCGINCSNMSFFFTKNDQVIAKDITLPETNKWNQFYPAVALQHQQETVKCYFEKKDFYFDIDKMAQDIQAHGIFYAKAIVTEEIFNQSSEEDEIPSSEIYSLISEYMLFNGYAKTLELMKQKKQQIQFQPVNKLTKSIYGTKIPINLDEEKLMSVKEGEYVLENYEIKSDRSGKKQLMKEESEQNEEKGNQARQKSRSRQRIMSDVHPEMLQTQSLMIEQANQPRRKNTELSPFELPSDYKLRKESNISNISLIDDDSIMQHKIEQHPNQQNHYHQNHQKQEHQFQESLTLNEKFLLNQRLQILSLIKEKKIQCAEKIIISKIPKLYELQPLLEPYMKAHIFLRKIIEQDQKSAIMYARTQQKFVKNVDKLFPTYDSATGTIEMIPMKRILTAIVQNKTKEDKFLKKEQFEYFAEYVNSSIMKWMGVMGNSRLGVILEHTAIVLRKLNEFKGMTCGIKLVN